MHRHMGCTSIADPRQRREADVERLDAGVRRLTSWHIYHVALIKWLWVLKLHLIAAAQVHEQ